MTNNNNDRKTKRELDTNGASLEEGHDATLESALLAGLGSTGRPQPASEKYMHVSVNEPARMWAETYFKNDRDFARERRRATRIQMDTGLVDHQGHLLTSIVGRLSVGGYAREQAKEVDIKQPALGHDLTSMLSRNNPDGKRRNLS